MMKCIDDELLQKYIDGELEPQERAAVEEHIAVCSRCVRKMEAQKQFVEIFKSDMNRLGREPEMIPAFDKTAKRRKTAIRKRFIIYAAAAAAACALLLILIGQPKENPEEFTIIYGIDGSFDANKPYLQQDMVMYLVDKDGNVMEL